MNKEVAILLDRTKNTYGTHCEFVKGCLRTLEEHKYSGAINHAILGIENEINAIELRSHEELTPFEQFQIDQYGSVPHNIDLNELQELINYL